MNTAIIITDSTRLTTPFTPPVRLDALLHQVGVPFAMPCGGRGTCGKCRVAVSGMLSAPSAEEQAVLGDALLCGERLACRTFAEGDVEIRLHTATGSRIQTEGEAVLAAEDPWCEGLCVAIDVGTTTVAAYCYDAKTGARVSCAAEPNPQTAFGADVISRMEKAEAGESDALRAAITDCIRRLIAQMCNPVQVGGAVITGNTAMLTLLKGLCPSPLLRVPFRVEEYFGICTDPVPFGLPASTEVFLPRCISAYVGADITSAIQAAGLFSGGKPRHGAPVLLADIGTNGEIVLCANGRLTACSTAAGPAFEGAGIRMGMTASDGAISHVRYEDGKILFDVIGNVCAKGICGSGLIDAVAALLEAGVIDETGCMDDEADGVFELDDQSAYQFPGTDVVLTQADVRAVQLAKSAICAGMLTLIRTAGLEPDDVESLVIAGGFGTRIDPACAEKIGLIPEGFAKKARAVGNAAGMGASMAALSAAARKDSEAASLACETIELAANPLFMELYVECMLFGE